MRTEQELLQALQQNPDGTVAITSTARAARVLRQRYNQMQHLAGNRGWRSPQIFAWEPWLLTLWDVAVLCGVESRILLTAVQEAELWRQVLERDEAAVQTLSLTGLAEKGQRAWEAMQHYRISLKDVRGDGSPDARAFARWATELEKLCGKSSFLSSSAIEATLASAVQSDKLALPKAVFLVGFDRTTPSQKLLIDALHSRSCDVQEVELGRSRNAQVPAIVVARTLDEEIETAALWVRDALFENSSLRIGVIVPALTELRDRLDATFRRVLAPSSMDVHVARGRLPYEFSLGAPMHRMPAIRTALALLRWMEAPMPMEEVSWLLVHGSFSGGSDAGVANGRAMLDRRFRDRDYQLGDSVSFFAFRQWLSQVGHKEDAAFLQWTVERLFTEGKRLDRKRNRSYADWREAIEEFLAMADWELPAASDSEEYQLLRRWNALLNEFSSLHSVAGPVTFSKALEKLQMLAGNMLFTLESRNAPAQIVGAAESAGLSFDRIWWMNVHASIWPPRGHALAFLPWRLQHAMHMPYADPAEDYALALRVTKRILASADTAVVSFALQENDPTTASAHVPSPEIALSPVVWEALPGISMVAADDFLPQQNRVSAEKSFVLETVTEEPTVPFRASRISGGVTFLKHQAACPFRAFAELRLRTEPLGEPENGLSAAEQGNIVHQVLQNFWAEMQSQKSLLESTEEECRQRLREHTRNALRPYFQHAEAAWQKALLETEAERVEGRLMTWLEVERQRADFTVLKTEDKLEAVHLGDIELSCRVDRIDAVAQGIALIDYKTGPVNAKACDGDRPDEPQLPAYAVLRRSIAAEETPLAGVAFVGLQAQAVGFTSVGSLPGIFPASAGKASKKQPDFSAETLEEKQEAWRATLTRLAEEFQHGVAVVNPKKRSETCKYCAQALLCRISETENALRDANEEEEQNGNAEVDEEEGLNP